MHQLMDEQALQAKAAVAEIFAKQVVLRVKPQMAIGCHGDAARLEPPIFPVVDANGVVIERIAEDGLRQSTLADRQLPAGWVGPKHA